MAAIVSTLNPLMLKYEGERILLIVRAFLGVVLVLISIN